MKNAPVTSASVSTANPARMLWKQPDSTDSMGVRIRSQPSGRRLRALREGRLEQGRGREQQSRDAAQARPQRHADRGDGDHDRDQCQHVAERQRRHRIHAALLHQRRRVHRDADRRDRGGGDPSAAAVERVALVGRQSKLDGAEQVAGDGDERQQQARACGG